MDDELTRLGEALEALHEQNGLLLSRVPGREGLPPRLLLSPASSQAATASLVRLAHIYSLRDGLNPSWATTPLELSNQSGKAALLLLDPGGECLDRVLCEPMCVSQCLRIAIGIVASLGHFHAQGLIHRDIKPANILVNVRTGQAWLTGFGVTSRLRRHPQSPEPPETIAGTLAYMAPEQTGRMNRSIDSRSDLYSLGVTLYALFVGELPFSARDPMEWIHCHIARQPIPPNEQTEAIPAALSAIIMKLLAKAPEERYQTAAGAEADLRRCLGDLESAGTIESFPLGSKDLPDRLLIPEKLYGRERETELLLAAFDRVASHGRTEFVLLAGYSGVGKSALVNGLHRVLLPRRGLFASGKFEQFKRGIPYSTIAQAFQRLVRQILTQSDEEVLVWRSRLLEALASNGQIIANLIPEIELIIGEQPAVPTLSSREEQTRFQTVFRNFLGVFARPEHPLTLFLDDLQWLDSSSLRLLENLLAAPEDRPLLIVGAYRDSEVGDAHPLTRALENIRQGGVPMHELVLTPLQLEHINALVADSLQVEGRTSLPLARLLHEKTGGNPFFLIQFFAMLAEEGLLAFDYASAAWAWDVPRIRAKGYTDNVLVLMGQKLERLSVRAQDVLKHLACMGNVAEISALAMVCEQTVEALQEILSEAVEAGLVLWHERTCAFLHDRVQEAAYVLLTEDERSAAHLQIGRILVSRTGADALDERIFEIVNQLNRGISLLHSCEERERVAELNLIAGRRARASAAYGAALAYLTTAHGLLREDSWLRTYRLTFEIELLRAECEFLNGQLAAAETLLSELARRPESLVDRAAVVRLRSALYMALDRSDRAIEIGLQYLRHAGIEWSVHPTNEEVYREVERLEERLGGRLVAQLFDLPLMSDKDCLANMGVLAELIPSAYFTDTNLLDLILFRMANLSLEHGNCDASCAGYSAMHFPFARRFGDYRKASQFGQLAYDLVEKRGMDRYRTRVYSRFGGQVAPWTRNLRDCDELLRRGMDVASASGDAINTVYISKSLVVNSLALGCPLADVQRSAEEGLDYARIAGFAFVDIFAVQQRFVRTLRGLTPEFASFNDTKFDEREFEARLEGNPRLAYAAAIYWNYKLQARFFAQDTGACLEAAAKTEGLLWSIQSQFDTAEYHFYGALARASACDSASAEERRMHLEAVSAHHQQMAAWAENCAETFASRVALIAAEIARVEGRDFDAMRLYEQAIQMSRKHRYVQNEGLAFELASKFYAERGLETLAQSNLLSARGCYQRWGALGKVRQIDQRHPHLCQQPDRWPRDVGSGVENLDVVTVVKASQVLSGEIVLDHLIEKLMRITVEHAGAGRGVLILFHNHKPLIEAEALTVKNAIEVVVRRGAISSSDLPESVFHYVVRTRESLVLDDASGMNSYSNDEYVLKTQPKSILCLPIVKQAELAGVLYLENSLTSHAFASDRVAVLEMLASQAAISLENARLYAELENENAERKRAEDELRRSEELLAEGQRISHTGSWTWNVHTGRLVWSAEQRLIFGFAPDDGEVTLDRVVAAVHSSDLAAFLRTVEDAQRSFRPFDHEFRIVWPDKSIRHIQASGRPLSDKSSGLEEYIGAVTDITDRKRAEEELRRSEADLRRVQAELAHATRVTTMGELAASIAHEVSQPIVGVVVNANTCWRRMGRLEGDSPNLAAARESVQRILRDGTRAGEVLARIRALFKNVETAKEPLELNAVIREILELARGEMEKRRVLLCLELARELPAVLGDRVQLQQVILNLALNAIDAMSTVEARPRELFIGTEAHEPDQVRVTVRDCGVGIDAEATGKLFTAFHTTKPGGLGMGLAISRTIVENHGGQLWAAANDGPGAVFRFTLRTRPQPRGI